MGEMDLGELENQGPPHMLGQEGAEEMRSDIRNVPGDRCTCLCKGEL